jgi:cation transport ATPase
MEAIIPKKELITSQTAALMNIVRRGIRQEAMISGDNEEAAPEVAAVIGSDLGAAFISNQPRKN